MKILLCMMIFLVTINSGQGQPGHLDDSLRAIVNQNKSDTTELRALIALTHQTQQLEAAIDYGQRGLSLARKIKDRKGEADCMIVLASVYGSHANFSQAIAYALGALNIFEELQDPAGVVSTRLVLQANYRDAGDYKNSVAHARAGEETAEAYHAMGTEFFLPGHRFAPLLLAELGQTYILKNQLDSASFFTQKSILQNELFNGTRWNFPFYLIATIQSMQGNWKAALANYHLAASLSVQNGVSRDALQVFSGMSTLFIKTGELDSAIYYAQIVARSMKDAEIKTKMESVRNLAQAYKTKGNLDKALTYVELSHSLGDSIYSNEKAREVQRITFNEQMKQQEILSEQGRYKSRVQVYSLTTGLLITISLVSFLWYTNRQKQKAKTKVEKAYADLKMTQAQLIQSEKMASLGELTAGIAHEIQNPLNFVNNFSEMNKELLGEMVTAIERGDFVEVKALAKDVVDNEAKINHHGKRADGIVKGMLQHSRSNSGIKEPTDINVLADEYLRLAYHGLRAKDKSFNAKFETDFDESIGKVNVIPQDIGRVILNLITNAFYTVTEKKKHQPNGYEPTVTVTTKKIGDKVQISVKDNGNGIPQNVVDKIFQPFFTTKPTGQGTGLGLSLSYDIVTAHGGELRVKTEVDEGAEFIIVLPVG